jgi:CoA-transferase family III
MCQLVTKSRMAGFTLCGAPEGADKLRGTTMPKQPLPLAGIRVIDFTHFLAGPYLNRCLAAFGAEVIKVERPPAGDEARG